MDKARSFEFIYRLPADTLEELRYKELVYDHQVLLNESWREYAIRSGQGSRSNEDRVKWITETWEKHESRKNIQSHTLDIAAKHSEKQSTALLELAKQGEEKSRKTIAHLMAAQRHLESERTQCRHGLFVDFDNLQQRKFTGEQNIVMTAEGSLRFIYLEYENELRESILLCSQFHRFLALTAMRKRLQEEEEERQRIAEEKERAIEEMRRQEEMRQKELEEAERVRKEAMEQEKFLERKRREEERRAKAKLERERHKQQLNTNNNQEISPAEDVLSPSSTVEVTTYAENTQKE